MSRHISEYGTFESHYYTQPNYDEGVGAWEFGVWHTQQREGLIELQVQGGGSYIARIPPPVTPIAGYPASGVSPVVPRDHGGPREPTKSAPKGPGPTPGGPKDTGGGRVKPTKKPKLTPVDSRSPWLKLVSGGFRSG